MSKKNTKTRSTCEHTFSTSSLMSQLEHTERPLAASVLNNQIFLIILHTLRASVNVSSKELFLHSYVTLLSAHAFPLNRPPTATSMALPTSVGEAAVTSLRIAI